MKPLHLTIVAFIATVPVIHAQDGPPSIRRTVVPTDQSVSDTTPNALKRNYIIKISGSLGKSDPMNVTLRGSSSKFRASLENPNRTIEIILREDGDEVHVLYSLGARIPIKTSENNISFYDANVTGSFIATLGEPFSVLDVGDSTLTIEVDDFPPKKK